MAAEPKSVSFETTVAATGNNTGIVVPEEVIEKLAAGKRPPVVVSVNGYEYRNTVGVMGGKHMISISAAVRKATGLKGGDPIRVTLTLADTPRDVTIPIRPPLAWSACRRPWIGSMTRGRSGRRSASSAPTRRISSGCSTWKGSRKARSPSG